MVVLLEKTISVDVTRVAVAAADVVEDVVKLVTGTNKPEVAWVVF